MNITCFRLIDFSKVKDLALTSAVRRDINTGFITVCNILYAFLSYYTVVVLYYTILYHFSHIIVLPKFLTERG